jgi:hypothetical protein
MLSPGFTDQRVNQQLKPLSSPGKFACGSVIRAAI